MTPAAVLADLRSRGVELWVDGGQLRYRAPAESLTDDLLATLKAHKPDLLRELSHGTPVSTAAHAGHPGRTWAAATKACADLGGHITAGALLSRLTHQDLGELERLKDPLAFLRAFADACMCTDRRRRGEAPPSWTATAHCERCGPVLLWASMTVAGCPWCWNRVRGVKIPRPELEKTP